MNLQKSQNPQKKTNYQKQLEQFLAKLAASGKRPKLLLHACCGPCSSYCLEYLYQYFDITVFFYNPNIYPEAEYQRRLQELKDLYKVFPPALEDKIKLVEMPYNPDDFYTAIKIKEEPQLADEPEKGVRCHRCYEFRLKAARKYAEENNFDYFCTTLSISPFKDSVQINEIGEELTAGAVVNSTAEEVTSSQWLTSDFKKNNGFKRSLEISEEYNLYRQQYCGCVYSQKTAIIE